MLQPYTFVTAAAAAGWNPADKAAAMVLSGGDLVATITASHGSVRSVTGRSPGGSDRYAEITVTSGGGNVLVGIGTASATLSFYPGADSNGRAYYGNDGKKYINNTDTAYGASYTDSAVIGVRFNSNGDLIFSKNGASQGTAFAGLTGTWFLMWGPGTGGAGTRVATINTGQSAFAYAPSGVVAWG